MTCFHCSGRSLPFSVVFLSLLVTILSSATLVAAQGDDDASWVLFDRSQFDGNATLDEKGDVRLFWKTGDEYSTFGIAARSGGYLGLGFSETGAMTGADIALGYKNSDGKFVFENRHATGFVEPELSSDQHNNMRFKEGDQKNGITSFVFEKKNQADCIQEQVTVNKDTWQWFIYAFSDENTFAKHQTGKNGNKYVKLGTSKTISLNEVRNIPNTKNFSVTHPELTVPTNETTYCYTLHKVPEGKKNFILGEQPASSGKLLHHLVVYSCYDLPEEAKSLVGQKPDCDYLNFQNPCTGFVSEWAPGMSGRTFEPGYGKPFGSDLYEYVMLETHYNNPDGLEGEKDSSGYTFFYNDEQVDNEVGTLTLGEFQVTGWSLEPGKEIATHKTVCTPDCTKKWPEEGITAVSVFHHMHRRGRNARVQIIRDGNEITPLSTLHSFEYGYQFTKSLGEIKLLPGDQLITTCEFDTTKDTSPVPGGFASKDEMCFAWVDYYPANDVLICSQFDLSHIPKSPLNGTAALCVESKGSPQDFVFPSNALNATFKSLPVSGETCPATDSKNGAPSGTSAAPVAASTSPTSPASSLMPSLLKALFTFAGALTLSIMFH